MDFLFYSFNGLAVNRSALNIKNVFSNCTFSRWLRVQALHAHPVSPHNSEDFIVVSPQSGMTLEPSQSTSERSTGDLTLTRVLFLERTFLLRDIMYILAPYQLGTGPGLVLPASYLLQPAATPIARYGKSGLNGHA